MTAPPQSISLPATVDETLAAVKKLAVHDDEHLTEEEVLDGRCRTVAEVAIHRHPPAERIAQAREP